MKQLLLVLLCSSVFFFAQAQITLLSTDLPTAPDTLRNAVDTIPSGISAGPKGANQTWDFSNAVQDIIENTAHRVPSTTAYSADFPTATAAVTTDGSNFAYFRNTANAFICQGLAGPLLGAGTNPISVQFSPTFDLYRFPVEYNDAYTANYGFVETQNNVTVPGVPIPVYQVRVTFTSTYFDSIDGWGNVTTPTGTYASLRQERIERTRTLIEFKATVISPWSTADDIRDTTTTYSWLAKESQGAVASIQYNSTTGAVSRFTYSLTPPVIPAPVADFSWVNTSGGLVQFTDLSTNSPTTWFWDFGDGATSSAQNPNHIYAVNSSYNVCLNVINGGGSDTICKNIQVTNVSAANSAPVAVNDSTNTAYETAVVVNAINNDLDPDGDNIAVTTAYNAANGTVAVNGNGTITFTPATGFSGSTTFQYAICDDGVPSLCDTATVYIEVGTAPVVGVANFTAEDTCLSVFFTNTSTEQGTIAWTFGDGASSGNIDTVTHVYSAAGTYEVCLSVSGFVGSVDTCYNITIDSCITDGIGSVSALALQVYPNPATSQLTVVMPQGTQGGTLAIINNLGLLVKEIVVTNNRTTVSINELAAGIYHLTYTSAEGTLGAGRFVKE